MITLLVYYTAESRWSRKVISNEGKVNLPGYGIQQASCKKYLHRQPLQSVVLPAIEVSVRSISTALAVVIGIDLLHLYPRESLDRDGPAQLVSLRAFESSSYFPLARVV